MGGFVGLVVGDRETTLQTLSRRIFLKAIAPLVIRFSLTHRFTEVFSNFQNHNSTATQPQDSPKTTKTIGASATGALAKGPFLLRGPF